MKVDLLATSYKTDKKGDVKRLRRQGKIPAVLYGHGEKTKTIYVEFQEFKKVLHLLKKEAIMINLKVENETYPCVIKAIQHNPINDELFHIDFQHVHEKEKIKATIPIHLLGAAPGIEMDGILESHLHEVVVKCLPSDMPSYIDVDISKLGLGQTIHLKDIKLSNVDFELTLETSVVSVVLPKKVEEVKPVVAEEAVVAEGEVKEEGVEEEAKEGEEKPTKEKEKEKSAKEKERPAKEK